jgi:hypothetical protein
MIVVGWLLVMVLFRAKPGNIGVSSFFFLILSEFL